MNKTSKMIDRIEDLLGKEKLCLSEILGILKVIEIRFIERYKEYIKDELKKGGFLDNF